jgi:hypothetical protein
MNNTDNFEAIAQDAVQALTAAAFTLRLVGDEKYQGLADALADEAAYFCDRAIALGGV